MYHSRGGALWLYEAGHKAPGGGTRRYSSCYHIVSFRPITLQDVSLEAP